MTSAVTPHIVQSTRWSAPKSGRDALSRHGLDIHSRFDVASAAAVLRLFDAELNKARALASQLEAANSRVPEIMGFELFSLRLQFESVQAPGVFATTATKQTYTSTVTRLEQERRAALESSEAAKMALEEVRRIRADPVGYVHNKISREQPGLITRTAALLKNVSLVEQARAFNRKLEERRAVRDWENCESFYHGAEAC